MRTRTPFSLHFDMYIPQFSIQVIFFKQFKFTNRLNPTNISSLLAKNWKKKKKLQFQAAAQTCSESYITKSWVYEVGEILVPHVNTNLSTVVQQQHCYRQHPHTSIFVGSTADTPQQWEFRQTPSLGRLGAELRLSPLMFPTD